ncbi:MAG TPA: PQQ-binding-like beta-propeller repeat protein [Verrucomicrobiae bacterium]|jgi:outer membrane protein assembly factor BamB|nr:PQQ-binding-like beta-propeller repeat protein [Verrucomicrobiae bacterium]
MNTKFFWRRAALAGLALALTTGTRAADSFWPQWRGPLCNGTAPDAHPPITWNETNHVQWKTAIPGEGDATPIVWGDRVFILTAVGPEGAVVSTAPKDPYQFTVICVDRQSGKVLWKKVAHEEVPHEGRQENNTFASASPIADGKHLFAFFGSRGLYAYDFDGNLAWQKDLGRMKTKMGFGEGASPALAGDTLVIDWDDESGHSFITALDKKSGQELWRTPRDEATGWSTPLIVDFQGAKQVVVNASKAVRSYDLATGREIWSCTGQTANAIPSPVALGDVVYLTSGFRGAALEAVRLGKTGDLTGTDAIVWSHPKGTPYIPSPLLVGDRLYELKGTDAILSCFDAKTGAAHFEQERLEGLHAAYASPVAAGGNIYVLGREGVCVVLKDSPKLEVVSVNKLAEDHTDASMALAGDQAFIRTRHSLYCLKNQ